MRIDAGSHKGTKLIAPEGDDVRPTSDRARQAIFNMLIHRFDAVEGASVIDAFAGSGALGLEALSRGAASVDFVEISPRSIAALKANIEALSVGEVARVHRSDALRFAARLAPLSYDIAFADPPYTIEAAAAELVRSFRETSERLRSVLIAYGITYPQTRAENLAERGNSDDSASITQFAEQCRCGSVIA